MANCRRGRALGKSYGVTQPHAQSRGCCMVPTQPSRRQTRAAKCVPVEGFLATSRPVRQPLLTVIRVRPYLYGNVLGAVEPPGDEVGGKADDLRALDHVLTDLQATPTTSVLPVSPSWQVYHVSSQQPHLPHPTVLCWPATQPARLAPLREHLPRCCSHPP